MVGLSSIAVRVVEDATGRPIKGATVVAVVFAEATYVKNTITDREGRALLLGLAKGRVRVSSGHQGFLSATYGAERPGEDGTYITLVEGQQVPAITIRLKRGSVIAGTITNDAGEPMAGVSVQAYRRSFSGGRQLFSRTLDADFTDDRGAYRIRNLIPGDYLVGVVPRTYAETTLEEAGGTNADDPIPFGDPANPRGLIVGDFEDGRVVMSGASEPQPLALDDRLLAYPPTFYPGAPAATASIITIGTAELRSGVDFQIDPVPVVRVSGRIVGLADGTLIRATLALVPVAEGGRLADTARHITITDSSGTFAIGSVPLGQYVLEVRANENVVNAISMWASVPLSVAGINLTDLVVPLNEGMTLSGQIQFASSAVESTVRGLKGVQMTLTRTLQIGSRSPNPRALIAEDGRFVFRNLAPGEYVARLEGLPYGWLASSAIFDGRDTLDFGLRVQPGGNVEGMVVTVTDKLPEVSGMLRDAADRPSTAGWVVLFPEDKAYWTGTGRRMQGVRPGTEGRFVFRSVPPGTYLVVAADAEPGQWLDPSFLEQIAPRAMRIVVREGE
ncbi:MAG TPA: carboxypeptidase-like regulatory domain-containing protein, partial [Vicinamibacterales bacterium]